MLTLSHVRSLFAASIILFAAAAPLGAQAAPADDARAAVQRFVDALNAGDIPRALTMCGSATVVDDIPPYVWSGPDSCTSWFRALGAYAADIGITKTQGVIDAPAAADVHDTSAYFVFPARLLYTIKGAPSTKTGTLTFVMQQAADGWKFTHVLWSRTGRTP